MSEVRNGSAILVTVTRSASGLACLRSLGSKGVQTIAASEQRNAPAFSSKYCNESIVIPSSRTELREYRGALLSIASRPDVRTVVPTREIDAYILAKNRDEFDSHVTALWPPFETLTAVQDRLTLMEAATEIGVPVPETQLLGDVDDWSGKQVVKPRYSILTSEYVDSMSPNECNRLQDVTFLPPDVEPDRDAILSKMGGHEPIVQEYVPSENEYGFAALYDRGTPVTTFQKRHIRCKSCAGGPSVYRESTQLRQLEEYGRRLLDHLDWRGLAEVQFLREKNSGEFKLLEINPFVWGSVPCAIRAGANFPYDYWLVATGDRDRVEMGYELGVATHFLYGELEYLKSVLRDDNPFGECPSVGEAILNIATSVITDPHFDHFQWTDPQPFVRGALNSLPLGGTNRTDSLLIPLEETAQKKLKENVSYYSSSGAVNKYENVVDRGLFEPEREAIRKYFTNSGSRVLDLGCGAGRTTKVLDEMGFDVVGVDVSEQMVLTAKNKFPSLEFQVGDASSLGLQNESFEYVLFSWNGISELSETQRSRVLEEIHRVLKPEGTFVFSNYNSVFYYFLRGVRYPRQVLEFWLRNIRARTMFSKYKLRKRQPDSDERWIGHNYFIDPLRQKKQLRNHEFDVLTVIGSNRVSSYLEPSPYYVCRKRDP